MDNSIVGIGIALGVSIVILYTRKKKWQNPKIVWLVCIGLLVIGLYGILISKTQIRENRVMFIGFCVPVIYWTFDRVFKRVSENIHGRDFLLFLRNSDEIDNGFGAENLHVKASDKIISLGLLIIIVVTLVIGVLTV